MSIKHIVFQNIFKHLVHSCKFQAPAGKWARKGSLSSWVGVGGDPFACKGGHKRLGSPGGPRAVG